MSSAALLGVTVVIAFTSLLAGRSEQQEVKKGTCENDWGFWKNRHQSNKTAPLNAGTQYVIWFYNISTRSGNVTAVHLVGSCTSAVNRCFATLQIWRPFGNGSNMTLDLIHAYNISASPTDSQTVTTDLEVPITGTPLPVQSGDVVGIKLPNSSHIEIAVASIPEPIPNSGNPIGTGPFVFTQKPFPTSFAPYSLGFEGSHIGAPLMSLHVICVSTHSSIPVEMESTEQPTSSLVGTSTSDQPTASSVSPAQSETSAFSASFTSLITSSDRAGSSSAVSIFSASIVTSADTIPTSRGSIDSAFLPTGTVGTASSDFLSASSSHVIPSSVDVISDSSSFESLPPSDPTALFTPSVPYQSTPMESTLHASTTQATPSTTTTTTTSTTPATPAAPLSTTTPSTTTSTTISATTTTTSTTTSTKASTTTSTTPSTTTSTTPETTTSTTSTTAPETTSPTAPETATPTTPKTTTSTTPETTSTTTPETTPTDDTSLTLPVALSVVVVLVLFLFVLILSLVLLTMCARRTQKRKYRLSNATPGDSKTHFVMTNPEGNLPNSSDSGSNSFLENEETDLHHGEEEGMFDNSPLEVALQGGYDTIDGPTHLAPLKPGDYPDLPDGTGPRGASLVTAGGDEDFSDHEYQQADEIPTNEEDRVSGFLPGTSEDEQNGYQCVPTVAQREQVANDYSQDDHEYNTLQSAQSFARLDAVEDCESEIYWAPGEKEEEIYAQMAQWGYQEIPRSFVNLSKKLGEGQFGEVYKAELKAIGDMRMKIAVKLVKKGSCPEEKMKLLQEAATLGQFKHRHVVRLIGVVTVGEPKMMLMEFLSGGDLKAYLDGLKKNSTELANPDLPSLLLQFCKQVVDGLACLARKGFVHRDIAARNILLDEDLDCKISDFGMTRDLEKDNFYCLKKGSRIPVKWTAPETIFYKKYSTGSDVWSYGMLMYEIWSVGHKPFEDTEVEELVRLFHTKYCQPPPPGCPRAVYEIMVKCWNYKPSDRPSAEDILGGFCRSERQLLSWKEKEVGVGSACSPLSRVLGSPLSEGQHLYTDLQTLYSM